MTDDTKTEAPRPTPAPDGITFTDPEQQKAHQARRQAALDERLASAEAAKRPSASERKASVAKRRQANLKAAAARRASPVGNSSDPQTEEN